MGAPLDSKVGAEFTGSGTDLTVLVMPNPCLSSDDEELKSSDVLVRLASKLLLCSVAPLRTHLSRGWWPDFLFSGSRSACCS